MNGAEGEPVLVPEVASHKEPLFSVPKFPEISEVPKACRQSVTSVIERVQTFIPPDSLTSYDLGNVIETQKAIAEFLGALLSFSGVEQPYHRIWNDMTVFSAQEIEKAGRVGICRALQNWTFEKIEEDLRQAQVSLPIGARQHTTQSIAWAVMADQPEFQPNIPLILWDIIRERGIFGFEFRRDGDKERALFHFICNLHGQTQRVELGTELPKGEKNLLTPKASSFVLTRANS